MAMIVKRECVLNRYVCKVYCQTREKEREEHIPYEHIYIHIVKRF